MSEITEITRVRGIDFMIDFPEDSEKIDPQILESDHAGRYYSGNNSPLNKVIYAGHGIRSSMKLA